MQQQEVTRPVTTDVGRSLQELEPLIHKDLTNAREAAERASMEHFRAAGEKLNEALELFGDQEANSVARRPRSTKTAHGGFYAWVDKKFKMKKDKALWCMKLAKTKKDTKAANQKSMRAFQRSKGYDRGNDAPWYDDLKNTINGVDTDVLNRQKDELTRAQEREAQRKLASQLIDIGYKALATKLHPDKKGGSHEAMIRLNQVCDRLRLHV